MLGSVGEPINPAAWEWYHKHVGGEPLPHRRHLLADRNRRPHDHAATGRHALVPGSCTLPFPGIQAAIVDETGKDMPNGQGGILVVKRPWPSMIRTIWGDPSASRRATTPTTSRASTTWQVTAPFAMRKTATSPSPAASTTC
jgi:acetyl-CoA synthetase